MDREDDIGHPMALENQRVVGEMLQYKKLYDVKWQTEAKSSK